ncbi:MAG: phytanoyl-CoA dioxygenase family protein, partial [bacterium]
MPTKFLSPAQIEHFSQHGFLPPVRILDESEAQALRAQVEQFETNYPKLKGQLDFKANLILPCIDRLSRDSRLLDLMEDLLGPDLLHWNSTFRIKEPKTSQHAAWHQDTAYIKLKPFLSICWLALSSANSKSGCLRVIPGSHLGPLLAHSEGNDPDSILSRAQYITEVFDQSGAIDIELAPGEATVINHAIIHASSPNQSDDRRIGLLM